MFSWYLRSYLYLKAENSRLSKGRNVKVGQSGAQMCVRVFVCACLRMFKRSVCVHLDWPQNWMTLSKLFPLWFGGWRETLYIGLNSGVASDGL